MQGNPPWASAAILGRIACAFEFGIEESSFSSSRTYVSDPPMTPGTSVKAQTPTSPEGFVEVVTAGTLRLPSQRYAGWNSALCPRCWCRVGPTSLVTTIRSVLDEP